MKCSIHLANAVVLDCQLYQMIGNGLERVIFAHVTAVESDACARRGLFSDCDIDGWLSCTTSVNTGGLSSTVLH